MTPEQLAKLQKSSAAARAKFQATYAAAQKPAQTPVQTPVSSGMSAQTPQKNTGSIPQSAPAPGSQASHQAYINREGNPYGGLSGYVANQQNRYNQALAAGDTDLINRLNADSQRVGYTLQAPQQQVQAPPNVTPSGGFIPQDAVTNVRSSSDLNQLANDQTTQERAALLRSINDQIANVKNSSQYANKLIQDNRTLEDQSLLRNLNPFNGRTGYQLAQVQRGRSIDDTSRAATLENQLNTINQEMTDFDKLTPERQREIYNQLLTMERDFGLNVGQLTGTYGGQQTLAARTADQNYGLGYAGLFGTLPGNSQGASGSSAGAPTTLAAQNQAFNQNMTTQQFNFQKAQQEWENMFKQKSFDEDKAARLWEQAFKEKSFSQDVKDAAASRGLQWASLDQRQKEFVADQAFREKQFTYQQEQDALASRNKPPVELSVKESTDNYNMLLDDLDDPDITKEEARMLLQQNSAMLNDSDYKKFNDEINSRF